MSDNSRKLIDDLTRPITKTTPSPVSDGGASCCQATCRPKQSSRQRILGVEGHEHGGIGAGRRPLPPTGAS